MAQQQSLKQIETTIKLMEANDLSNIRKSIECLYSNGKFIEAQQLLPTAFEIAKQVVNKSSNDFCKELIQLYGLAGDIFGELGDFKQSMQYYEHFQCLKMQLKTNLFSDSKSSETYTLYQFRKFTNYTLANLLNKEITLSRPNQMNDIVDSLVFTWLESPCFGAKNQHKAHLAPYKESFRDYRIASFCEDNPKKRQYALQNTLMWSHYADEHKGFCVEYVFHSDDFRKDDFSKLTASRLFKINYYNPEDSKLVNLENLLSKRTLTTTDAFLTKHIDWSYENEVRLLQYKPKQGALREQYKLSDNTKIAAIYFGYTCLDTDIQIIKGLFENTDVKFYKMEIDYSNVYHLKHNET